VLDFGAGSEASHDEALRTVLSTARKQDALTLWHLLSRTQGAARAQVYDKFAAVVAPPSGVTRDGILRLDQSMLDLWWNALDLGDISIWRYWEQSPASGEIPAKPLMQKKQAMLKKLG